MSSNGHPLICVVTENVQEHVHAIRLHREGENELAWSHYYGELYIVPGVALEHITIAGNINGILIFKGINIATVIRIMSALELL